MGKPPSCFKIITCGGDSKDHEDIDVPENKATGEKRGWSFRKRSARQRVLSNSVIAETLPSEFKDSFETAGLDSQQTANSKFVTDCVNEKPELSCPEDAKPFEVVVSTQDEDEDDGQMEESIAIVIQTAIRGLLAQMALTKLKSVVKLQAAVRGHVVRRHAVGTLRCIQAIVKMQALVRARSSLRSSGGLNGDKSNRQNEHDLNRFKTRETKEFDKSKLLSNRFAQQLLDSTPKTASINIKCDPLKPNSAWKWLERWMSVSAVDTVEQRKAEMISEKAGSGKVENFVSQLDDGIDSEVCDSDDANFIEKKSSLKPEGEAELNTREDESLEVQACEATTSSSSRETEEMKDTSLEAETGKSSPDQMAQSVVYPQSQCDYNPEKKVAEDEQPIMKGVLSEQLENDCRKSVVGSRKATNPAFIAAQSRFEVLSSTANSGKSTSLSLEENTESREQTVSSPADTAVETKELDSSENFSLPGSRVMLSGGSECGTELSISSTLDSPDRCDSGTFELEHNGNVLAEDIPDSSRCKTADVGEVDVTPAISLSNLSQPILDEPKKSDLVCESIILGDSPDSGSIEVKAESNIFHKPAKVDSETGNQACRLSPEASPNSHITVPESQGTPSSQLSVKANKNKVDNSGSNSKRKSLSASKKSHSKNTHNSGSRSSPDHSAKDQKIGKRRNSFGSATPDNVELESRDSTSNNSLPHFMQATESARAKLNSNNSPRSSPDIQDRDVSIKRRRSLSGTNGRQGSPRIQRSMSQAQQSAKGNENKWQR